MATGEIAHVEFPADDVERAKRFYTAVAGWEFGDDSAYPGYFMFRTGPESGGGLGKRGESVGSVIRAYITVDNLESAVTAAEQNGGQVMTGISDVPGMGRYAALLDSEGNEIGLWENVPGA
jgi:hypothetical protein